MIAESARWGDYRRDMHRYSSGPYCLYTRDAYWTPERDKLINTYFPHRTEKALELFKSMGHSLEVIEHATASADLFSDKATWQASSLQGGTPGF